MTGAACGPEAAINTAQAAPTHAYITVHGGVCTAVHIDGADNTTARFVADAVRNGGFVERVTLDVARRAYMEPWPRPAGAGQ